MEWVLGWISSLSERINFCIKFFFSLSLSLSLSRLLKALPPFENRSVFCCNGQMAALDWLVIAATIALVIAIGFRLSRRQGDEIDYFLGGRPLGG
jgi:hypothetical protein